jgi:hypothetical protein
MIAIHLLLHLSFLSLTVASNDKVNGHLIVSSIMVGFFLNLNDFQLVTNLNLEPVGCHTEYEDVQQGPDREGSTRLVR